ncbi:DMT family transporter [Oenococcus alcoholitolerans]|uniref:DMT family transporter n=1 Tax=Oenococcus alcoholitolerans TaxID=931074 RepID=UPI003F7033F0
MYLVIAAICVGFILPMQTAVNSRLRIAASSPLLSSMISFTVGTISLLIVVAASGGLGNIFGLDFYRQPWWLWLGGLLGVVFLTGNILFFPILGSVQTVIMPVVGQILMGMLIDNFGWFSSPRHDINLMRISGCLLVLIGVFLAVASKDIQSNSQAKFSSVSFKKSYIWLIRIAAVGTGMLSAVQTAINGHLGTVLDSAIDAAFISFLIGTIALWILTAVIERGIRLSFVKQRLPWWIWIGGVIGACFVLGNAFMAPRLGTGPAVVIILLGQIVGSIFVDQFGWFRSRRHQVLFSQLIGVLVMISGTALIEFF